MSYYSPQEVEGEGLNEEFPQSATLLYTVGNKDYFIARAIKYFETDAPSKFLKVLAGPVPPEY